MRITLLIDDTDPVRGEVVAEDGSPEQFVGRLQLLAILEGLLGPRRLTPAPDGGGQLDA